MTAYVFLSSTMSFFVVEILFLLSLVIFSLTWIVWPYVKTHFMDVTIGERVNIVNVQGIVVLQRLSCVFLIPFCLFLVVFGVKIVESQTDIEFTDETVQRSRSNIAT